MAAQVYFQGRSGGRVLKDIYFISVNRNRQI